MRGRIRGNTELRCHGKEPEGLVGMAKIKISEVEVKRSFEECIEIGFRDE